MGSNIAFTNATILKRPAIYIEGYETTLSRNHQCKVPVNTQTPVQPRRTVTSLIAERQTALGLTDAQAASHAGYPSEAVYRFVKGGQMKLNVNHVCPLAKALQVEPGYLMRITLGEYQPELLAILEEAWGPGSLTRRERKLIALSRHVTEANNRDITAFMNSQSPMANPS